MKPRASNPVRCGLATAAVVLSLLGALLFCALPGRLAAQSVRVTRGPDMPPNMPSSPPPSSSSPSSSDSGPKGGGPWVPSEPLLSDTSTNAASTNDIQLSFQGASIDMVVQWLAQTTGKTIVKHPQVQCQITITSSKKVSPREAINIVYRALALEGFTAIESSKSILIVPEGKEPRMSPELVTNTRDIPEGRQRLAKLFTLKHVQAAELRDKIRNALSDKATVDIDERANQILITDYNDNIRVVGELIAALDSDKPEDVAVRVIPLKHIGALDLAKELTPLYQKLNAKSPRDAVDVAADERSNSLIVFSSEASFRAIERLVLGLDTEDAQEKTMETFILKNADAQDVAKQLQDLTQDSSVNARYYYVFSPSDNKGGKKVSVVADRRRNAVIIQAPPAQMEAIRKMIHELDEPVRDDSLAPRIYQMKYVSASDIEDVLNELFLKKTQQRSYWDYFDDYYSGNSGQTADRDVGRLYGKVRITSEPYSNTIIVTSNSKENLAVVEDVLRQLDVPSDAGESTLRVGMRFAKASVLARSINILFAKNGSPPLRGGPAQQTPNNNNNNNPFQQPQDQTSTAQYGFNLERETREEGYFPWLGGQPDNPRNNDGRATRPVSDLVGRVRAVADDRSNALLVSANVHYFPQILKLIDQLDAPSDQVLIEARIVEVSSDFMEKLGVRWSPDGSKVFTADDFDNSLLAHATATYRRGFGEKNNGVGPVTTTTTRQDPLNSTVTTALTSLRSGVLDSTINMDFLVQFLKKTADARMLGNPQVTINDNEMGKLFVGQQVPTLTAQNNPALGGTTQNFQYRDVGVILEVTPHINNDGDVQLKIHVESSAIVPGQLVLGTVVIDTRNFLTDLTVKNGQTRVLGGIIQRQFSDTLRKTPFLGSLPIVGWAFKKKDKLTHEVELMVFLRPTVVHSPEDADALMRDIDRRAPLIKEWRDEMQGKKKEKK